MFSVNPDRLLAFALEAGGRSLVLLLATGALALVLRRASASARSLLWRLPLCGLAALPLLSVILRPLPVVIPLTWISSQERNTTSDPPSPVFHPPIPTPSGSAGIGTLENTTTAGRSPAQAAAGGAAPYAPAPATPIPLGNRGRVTSSYFLIAWSVGVLLLLGRSLSAQVRLRRVAMQSQSAPQSVLEAAVRAAREIGIKRAVMIRVAPPVSGVVSPMTWGALKPVLLLPDGSERWPEGRLRAVVLHEMAHVARGDWGARWMADLVCTLYWPNPLVWIAAREMRRESEIACDDRVLDCGVRASDYASHLLEIVRMSKNARVPHTGAIAMAEPSLLETRVVAALEMSRSRRPASRSLSIWSIAVLIAALVPLAAMHLSAGAAAGRAKRRALPAATLSAPTASYPRLAEIVQPAALQRTVPVRAVPEIVPLAPQTVAGTVVWGRSVRGLQAGIERVDGSHDIMLGQRVGFRLWIRNTGQSTLTIRYLTEPVEVTHKDPFFWNVIVINGKNISIRPSLDFHGEATSGTLRLRSGEERDLPMPTLNFVVDAMGNSAVTAPTAFVTPGQRSVQVFPFVALAPEDVWMQKVGTGKIVLDVKGGPTNSTSAAPPINVRPNGPVDVLRGVAWGAPADGLAAGIRIVGAKKRFEPGERVPLQCYLRNDTDTEIALSYAVKLYSDQLPMVHDVANPGIEQRVKGVRLTGVDPAFLLILKPHETVIINHPGFVLGDKPLPLPEPNSVPKGLEQYPYLESPTPGQYTVQQAFAYHITTPQAVKAAADRSHGRERMITEPFAVTIIRPDGMEVKGEATTIPFFSEELALTTGAVPFAIGGKGPAVAGNAAARSTKQEAIAWGTAAGGLQAGLRAPKGRVSYPLGSTVAMDYIVRNIGNTEITFEHDVFPSVAGIIPEVLASNGKQAHTFGIPMGATSAVKRETLKPGEMIVLGQSAMGLAGDGVSWYDNRPGQETIRPKGEKTYTYMTAVPGSYRMRHLYTVYVSEGAGKLVLYTGYVPLEVFDSRNKDKK